MKIKIIFIVIINLIEVIKDFIRVNLKDLLN